MAIVEEYEEKKNLESLILGSVMHRVEEEVGKEFDRKIEELKQKKREVVCGVVLGISRKLEVSSFGEEIVLRIAKESVDEVKSEIGASVLPRR